MVMDSKIRTLLQQSNDFPGSATLIEGFMSCPAAGCRELREQEQDGKNELWTWTGPVGAGGVTDLNELMIDQWLDTVLVESESFVGVELESLAPFFFRLAVNDPCACPCIMFSGTLVTSKSLHLAASSLQAAAHTSEFKQI